MDALKQLGVGQFAKDIEFGNDMVRFMDAFSWSRKRRRKQRVI